MICDVSRFDAQLSLGQTIICHGRPIKLRLETYDLDPLATVSPIINVTLGQAHVETPQMAVTLNGMTVV
jgi:hypothetical protein